MITIGSIERYKLGSIELEEDKGGAGSGGARAGAGRKPGSGSKPSAASGVSQAENGQITIRKPKNVDEALAQIQAMKEILAREQAANDAEDPKVEGLRLAHARRQMQRAITNGRQIIAAAKR